MLRHVDLCSGIGGFALGFQWAELSKPVLFCDIDPWSRKILNKHWPDVPIAEDVKELANDPTRYVPDCDIISAGYPCQPFSSSGDKRGSKDDRHIWPEIFSIIKAKRPSWVICENVYGHINLGLDEVLSDLEGTSYAVKPFVIPACAVDAPHRRDRVWIIARNVSNTDSQRRCSRNSERQNAKNAWQSSGRKGNDTRRMELWKPEPPVGRVAHGIPRRVDRLRGLGNAIVPQIAQRIGETIKQCS